MAAIEAKQLSKSYQLGNSKVPVLENVNFSITSGEQIAVVGPSGVGKSTLLHLIGALDRPSSGDILLNEQSLATLSADQLADIRNSKIGFVFQFHHLLPEFTALENVLMPARLQGKAETAEFIDRAKSLLSSVGLSHRLSHRPGELSGGESQRVAVARALMNKPKIVIADEPTGNLDGEAAQSLQNLLEKLARDENATLIVATHNLTFANAMDRVLKVHDRTIDESKSISA